MCLHTTLDVRTWHSSQIRSTSSRSPALPAASAAVWAASSSVSAPRARKATAAAAILGWLLSLAAARGVQVPVDSSSANPNGLEYDNLFLDMNGIIHPASHPEDRPPPETEDDMYIAITDYLERVFAAVRPRKLLFMAIDGPAPRAKMNQTGRHQAVA